MPNPPWSDLRVFLEVHCNTVMRTDTIAGLSVAARAGMGIAPLPAFMAFGHAQLVRLAPPDHIAIIHTWLILSRDLRRVARVRALWDSSSPPSTPGRS